MGTELDWGAMLGVVHALFAVDELDDFGPLVLEELEALVPFDLGSFNEVDPEANRATATSWPVEIGMDRPEFAAWQELAYQNPVLAYQFRTRDGTARRISDFLGQDEFRRLDVYREVYRTLGVEYQVAVGLPAPRPLVIGIALSRTRRDFGDGEVALLNVLRAHLVQAYRNVQVRAQLRGALDGVTGILNREGRALVVLGDAGPMPLDDMARELLALHFGPFADGRLPSPVEQWVAAERSAFALGGPERLRQPLVMESDGRRLTARLILGDRTSPDVIVLDDRMPSGERTRLLDLGLSERESEVLLAVAQGADTAAVAARLGITIGTVRKHLERVYRKLGVSNRTAAVAQVIDVLASARRFDDVRELGQLG